MTKTTEVSSFTFNRMRNAILFTCLERNSIYRFSYRISFRIFNKVTLIRTAIQRYQTRLGASVNSPKACWPNHQKLFLQIFVRRKHDFRKIFVKIFFQLLLIWYFDHWDSLIFISLIVLNWRNIKSWNRNIFDCMHKEKWLNKFSKLVFRRLIIFILLAQ